MQRLLQLGLVWDFMHLEPDRVMCVTSSVAVLLRSFLSSVHVVTVLSHLPSIPSLAWATRHPCYFSWAFGMLPGWELSRVK